MLIGLIFVIVGIGQNASGGRRRRPLRKVTSIYMSTGVDDEAEDELPLVEFSARSRTRRASTRELFPQTMTTTGAARTWAVRTGVARTAARTGAVRAGVARTGAARAGAGRHQRRRLPQRD